MPAAIEVFRKIPEAIAGKNIPPEYRKKFDDAKIGADHSWNINAMHEVNRGFWSWHHKRGDVPSVLSRVRDWAMLPSFGSEQCCSYVYGNMNNSVYKAFYILAQVAGTTVQLSDGSSSDAKRTFTTPLVRLSSRRQTSSPVARFATRPRSAATSATPRPRET